MSLSEKSPVSLPYAVKPRSLIAVLGLDGAGKTTFLTTLRLGELTTEKYGWRLRTKACWYGSTMFMELMIGGCRSNMHRLSEERLYQDTDAIIWVLDAGDRQRLPAARKELREALGALNTSNTPVAVLCNVLHPRTDEKQLDEKRGLLWTASEVRHRLDRPELTGRHPWKCFDVDVKRGDGVDEALQWLERMLRDQSKAVSVPRVIKESVLQRAYGQIKAWWSYSSNLLYKGMLNPHSRR